MPDYTAARRDAAGAAIMPQGDTFHGFVLYLIIGGVTFPIWGPVMMAVCVAWIVVMLFYGFVFAPIRWAVIGIRRGDWDPDNFQRPVAAERVKR